MPMQTFIEGSIVVSLVYLAVLATLVVVLALRLGGRREESLDDHDALSVSRFTIPVSLIVAVTGDAESGVRHAVTASLSSTLTALLALNYPEFEVIVVADRLAEADWAHLKEHWGLEAKEFYYRQSLATAYVQKIYRSTIDARLMIVEKAPTASRADAMNCGVNLARFRYVSSVEPGVVFDADALLRAMSAPLKDPASVVAATSHVETMSTSAEAATGSPLRLHGAFQRLASIRALMDSRLAWQALQTALGPHDAVAVWRRDAIVQLGGFSTRAADPDLDMMIRLQTASVRGRVVRSYEIFGEMAPCSVVQSMRMRTRRQLAALQTVWSCRQLAAPTFGYMLVSELVTPLLQAWVVVATTLAAVAGWLTWNDVALAVILLSFGNAVVSGVALLLRGSSPGAPDHRALTRLLLAAPLDFIVSGSVAAYARTAGLWAFAKGALAGDTTK